MKELFAALVKARGAIKAPVKRSVNPHFKSKYAALDEIVEVSAGPLAENGLMVVQTPKLVEGVMMLHNQIVHSSGESLDCGFYALAPGRGSVQDMGSSITYARRYSLASILGLAAEDDDDGERTTASPPARAAKPESFQTKEWPPKKEAHPAKAERSIAQVEVLPAGDPILEHCIDMWRKEEVLQQAYPDPYGSDGAYESMRSDVKRLMGVKTVKDFLAVKGYIFAAAVEEDRK